MDYKNIKALAIVLIFVITHHSHASYAKTLASWLCGKRTELSCSTNSQPAKYDFDEIVSPMVQHPHLIDFMYKHVKKAKEKSLISQHQKKLNDFSIQCRKEQIKTECSLLREQKKVQSTPHQHLEACIFEHLKNRKAWDDFSLEWHTDKMDEERRFYCSNSTDYIHDQYCSDIKRYLYQRQKKASSESDSNSTECSSRELCLAVIKYHRERRHKNGSSESDSSSADSWHFRF